jgi:mutator protein MutT
MPAEKLIADRSFFPIVLAVVKNDQNQVLIARRNDETLPTAHNKWELIGGRIEWDEIPEQALLREVKEESGLDVEVVRLLPKIFVNHWTQIDSTEFKVLLISYECKSVGGQLHTIEFDPKIGQLKFIDLPDLDKYECISPAKEIIKLAYT